MPPTPGRLDPTLDARLVDRCLAGDGTAWEALVRRHERLVYAVSRRYRLSDSDSQDVFQEVFAALVKGLPRLRDGRALCGWLARTNERIARTLALRTRREGALTVNTPGAAETIPSERPGGEATLEMLEEQALIRLALAALPEGCRRLLIALYYEDPRPSYAHLARRWGIPMGSLGPTRARCIERLRRYVRELDPNSHGIRGVAAPTSSHERTRVEGPDRGWKGAPSRANKWMTAHTENSR